MALCAIILTLIQNKERLAEEEARRKRKEIERERKQKERFGMESYSTGGGYMPRGSSISSSSSRRYDSGPVIEKPISKPSPKSGMSSRKGLSLKPTAPKANDLMEVLQQEGNLNLDIQEPEYESSEVPSTLRDEYVSIHLFKLTIAYRISLVYTLKLPRLWWQVWIKMEVLDNLRSVEN